MSQIDRSRPSQSSVSFVLGASRSFGRCYDEAPPSWSLRSWWTAVATGREPRNGTYRCPVELRARPCWGPETAAVTLLRLPSLHYLTPRKMSRGSRLAIKVSQARLVIEDEVKRN